MGLPYNGYSWNFSQHAIALKPDNLFSLLSAASLFEGKSSFSSEINLVLKKQGVLTDNIRDNKLDAWRDYQQILAETGLICSTKLEKRLQITEAGRLLLSGEIGFSELMSIQALRYQYPNGLKMSFQEQQCEKGVFIKPGTLILRILIELFKLGKTPLLNIDQCQNFLLPVTKNEDWVEAFHKIKNNSATSISNNKHARRNIQDWFKFLNTTDIFDTFVKDRKTWVTLSAKSKRDIAKLESLCSLGENKSKFWLAEPKNKIHNVSWFFEFGHIPTQYYTILDSELEQEYITENFFGSEIIEDDDAIITSKIGLTEIPDDGIPEISALDANNIKHKIKSGFIKRREKTKLHNNIINTLAAYYKNKGFRVYDDKQSIDLAVEFSKNDISIFEVKTATLRNLIARSRLAVGQITEYGYRYLQDFGLEPQKNIVFNVDMDKQPWLAEYVNEYLDIGLVSVLGNEKKIYLPSACNSAINKIG